MIVKLLTVKDEMSVCCVSSSTLYRWRKSKIFPDSIGNGRLLWTEQQILDWQNRKQSIQQNSTLPSVSLTKQMKAETKNFELRQKNAKEILQSIAAGRKPKVKD